MFKIIPVFALLTSSSLFACTGVMMQAEDGSTTNGRTVEFATKIEMHAAFIPRNLTFEGILNKGSGKKYQSRYQATGIYCFEQQVLMDGINEKGLSAAAFYFPGYASYTPLTNENREKALSPVELPHYILTQFATLDEVKEGLKEIVVVPTVFASWGGIVPPFHYIVYDKEGNSLVIEPLNETLTIQESKIGAFTNSPDYAWHEKNLVNYLNLTTFNASAKTLRGLELIPFGQGSGMVGIPGDFTPPSRFVRAAIYSSTAEKVKNSQELIAQTFHILNQFDIPRGVSREKGQGGIDYDYTQVTSVKDPENLAYFVKTYEDQSIKVLRMSEVDQKTDKILVFPLKGEERFIDLSKSLQ